ncbi:MAG: TAXI family TRAP transporter solute-binding subunit [Alphaproteobacteria bacterium]|nr:TAXI family TRAP transporter solute-binding subunit [Alphaproteobacteria bacterium]
MRLTRLVTAAVAAAALAAAYVPAAAQDVLGIGVSQPGSLLYGGGAGIVKVLDERLKRQARLQPYAGSSQYVPLIDRNEIELGLVNVDDAMTGYRGVDNFDGKPNRNLRILCVIFPLPFGALVPADSAIRTMRELKGVRMPSQYAGMSTARKLQDAILAGAGLSTADMRGVPVANLFQGIDALIQGRVDAAVIGPGTGQIQVAQAQLAARGGVRYLDVEDGPEALAAMRNVMSLRVAVMNPAPHLPGIVRPTRIMFYSMFLMSNDQLADALAYDIVKALHGAKTMMAEVHPVLAGFDPGRMSEVAETPFHDGAIRFYREIGQWPPKD